ncbi:MAG: RusA family crossover junction endodeoxyribonuclease [Dehalococcoidia bacterium]|nr:RusA family crossover junction endodeoxyribonuclease [Dehalococcoidia bacterium]
MISITFVVKEIPPWKQVPADAAEREQQAERLKVLQQVAKASVGESAPLSRPCAVSMHYCRKRGRADSANIVGGVLDGLQRIVYQDDKWVARISYDERRESEDWYQVTVTELEVG